MNIPSTPPPLVELRDLTFGYGDRVILKNLSFNVPRGQVTALMGVSGGGKTTVLRLIGGQIGRTHSFPVGFVVGRVLRRNRLGHCLVGADGARLFELGTSAGR